MKPHEFIKEARWRLRMSQAELAKATGAKPYNVCKYEADSVTIPASFVFKVGDLLNIDWFKSHKIV